jgi:hypothetical protein
MGPSSTQKYSSFLVVEESEVGWQCFILVSDPMGSPGDPIKLDSGGCCEDDQMRANPPRSQRRGLKIFEENKIPWFDRSCYGAPFGWSRIWSACCLRSSQRSLR